MRVGALVVAAAVALHATPACGYHSAVPALGAAGGGLSSTDTASLQAALQKSVTSSVRESLQATHSLKC